MVVNVSFHMYSFFLERGQGDTVMTVWDAVREQGRMYNMPRKFEFNVRDAENITMQQSRSVLSNGRLFK